MLTATATETATRTKGSKMSLGPNYDRYFAEQQRISDAVEDWSSDPTADIYELAEKHDVDHGDIEDAIDEANVIAAEQLLNDL